MARRANATRRAVDRPTTKNGGRGKRHNSTVSPYLFNQGVLFQPPRDHASILHVWGVLEVVALQGQEHARSHGRHHRRINRVARRVKGRVLQSLCAVQRQGRALPRLLGSATHESIPQEAAEGKLEARVYIEARPKERSDRGRFLPLGKKTSSYRGAYRVTV